MKDTLRRKPTKSVDLDNGNDTIRNATDGSHASNTENGPRHQRSVSNASIMAGGTGERNPWDGDGLASSRKPDVSDTDDRGRAPNLEVPGGQRNERSVSEKPTQRRRKKTLNQVTPHRFELVDAKRDSMRQRVPMDSRSVTPTEDLIATKTRESRRSSSDYAPSLSFSKQHSLAEIQPALPKQQRKMFSRIKVSANIPPIEPPSPPVTPPRSITLSPPPTSGTRYNFMGDFGLSGNDQHFDYIPSPTVKTPLSAKSRQEHPQPNLSQTTPSIYRPPRDPLPSNSLMNKVVIVTNGLSVISSPLVRSLHRAGARVIFSAPSSVADNARKFIRELGPPDTVHFNACDLGNYNDIHALFRLGMTMYGRIDHAVFAPEDDGGQARGVGSGERLWGLDVGLAEGRTKSTKAELEIIERGEAQDPSNIDMTDIIGSSIRFARIAMAYLRNSPGRRQKHSTSEVLTPVAAGGFADSIWTEDRSLTFVSSTAAFTSMPYLPVYSTAQHAILGLVRSLSQSVDVRRDGVRVNLVATNMLLPSVVEAKGGGRMSVRLPGDKGEDVGLIVAGIVGNSQETTDYRRNPQFSDDDEEEEQQLHGRILYAIGNEAVDIQDGLDANEHIWLGEKAKGALDRAGGKVDGVGGKGRWMLMDALDSPLL